MPNIDRDAPIPASWGSQPARDARVPADWNTTLARDALVPAEWNGLIEVSRDAQVPADWGAQPTRDARVPADWSSQPIRDARVPAEWKGLIEVNRDARVPADWKLTLNRDAVVPASWGVTVNRDARVPADWSTQLARDAVVPADWGGQKGLDRDARVPAEWKGLIEVNRDARVPAEWASVAAPVVLPQLVQFTRVNLSSTVELAADRFNVEALGVELFTAASYADRLTLPLGLKDPISGVDLTITHIEEGVIDEYELAVNPNSMTVSLRGRDASALLLDRHFEKAYIYSEFERGPTGNQWSRSTEAQDQRMQAVFAPGSGSPSQGVPTVVGQFTAKRIAEEVAAAVGATLSWEVRDYKIVGTFTARGRASETLRRLVEPWTQVEPFRADIIVQGTTIIVRYRRTPPNPIASVALPGSASPFQNVFASIPVPSPTPSVPIPPLEVDYTLAVADMRRSAIRVRRRKTQKVGDVTLRGMNINLAGTNGAGPIGNGLGGPPGSGEVEVTQETAATATEGDMAGVLVKTITKTRYRMPQQVIVTRFRQSFGPFLIEEEETRNEHREFDQGPLLVQSNVTQRAWSQPVGAMALKSKITKTIDYDVDGFMVGETTFTATYDVEDPVGNPFPTLTLNTKTVTDIAPQMVEEVICDYTTEHPSATENTPSFWTLVRRDSQIQAGRRAGGAGRSGSPIPSDQQSQTRTQSLEVIGTLSSDPDAVPFEYSNPNLTQDDLNFLLAQLIAANTFTWELEALFSGVAMPWLQRAVVVQVLGLTFPDGTTPIALPPFYLTEVRSAYDESKADAEFTTEVRGFAWI